MLEKVYFEEDEQCELHTAHERDDHPAVFRLQARLKVVPVRQN